MLVTLINAANCPDIKACKQCRGEMAHINEVESGKMHVKCVNCGDLQDDIEKSKLYHICPKCYEQKLNLGTGKCGSCGAETEVEFLKPVTVSYNDLEREYSHK